MSRLRRLLHRCRDPLFAPAFDGLWKARLRGRVLCLRYPRVDEPGRVPFLDRFSGPPIPPTQLLDEVGQLYMHGARFLTFADLRRGRLPGPDQFGVILCLEEGLASSYRAGLGVLEWLGLRGVLLQASAQVDAPSLIWLHALYWYGAHPERAAMLEELAHQHLPASRPHRAAELVRHLRDQEPMAAVEDLLAELTRRSGSAGRLAELAADLYPSAEFLRSARFSHHEIASHGHHHYRRSGIDAAMFEQELKRSAEVIEAIVGRRPQAFAYPLDDHLPGDATLCALHYQQACLLGREPIGPATPPLELPRCSWPGPHRSDLRRRRWLWTGQI